MSGHGEPKLLKNAFVSSPISTRWAASTPMSPMSGSAKLKIASRRPLTSSQQLDIRPSTDWTFLMSGQMNNSRLVQRPWPEYVPETAAAVGRKWEGFNLSALEEGPLSPLRKAGRSPYSSKLSPLPKAPRV